MSDVQVGVRLLDYVNQLTTVVMGLSTASSSAHAAADMFAGDGFYSGRAEAELCQFYASLAANVDKLTFFESVAIQYLQKVFETFSEADQELALTTWLDGL